MRTLRCAILVLFLAGCSSATARAPRMPSLWARARATEEPLSTPRAWAAVAYATRQVGKRYCRGGTGPSCFDCSGLVEQAWASVGVRLPHSSEALASAASEVPLRDVRAGDVLWWPGHVAIYAGRGMTVEALDSRSGVVQRIPPDPYRAFRPPG